MGESINGETQQFKTVDHVTGYPVVRDSISAYKSNPYGAKSVSLATDGYNKIVAPTLPYFEKPYSYVSPYVKKADLVGDSTLTKIDERFPVVKSETKELQDTAFSYIHYPFGLFDDGKKYIFDAYGEEYKKCGGDGILAGGKAVITTSLITASDILSWVSGYISQKKEAAKGAVKDKTQS